MAITIRDAQSADMAGWVTAQEIFDEWVVEFMTPAVVDQFRLIFTQLTPVQHRQLQEMDPANYARVKQFISGKTPADSNGAKGESSYAQ